MDAAMDPGIDAYDCAWNRKVDEGKKEHKNFGSALLLIFSSYARFRFNFYSYSIVRTCLLQI